MNSQPQSQQAETRPLSLVEKASILTETLPWLETYAGKIVVIKYGGNAMISITSRNTIAPVQIMKIVVKDSGVASHAFIDENHPPSPACTPRS